MKYEKPSFFRGLSQPAEISSGVKKLWAYRIPQLLGIGDLNNDRTSS